jgi:hypothetical protein
MEEAGYARTAMGGPDHVWSARPAAFTRCDLGRDYPPWDRPAVSQLPGLRRGPDDAEPAAADVPPVDTGVDSGELSAAQLLPVLVMHDAGYRSQIWLCSRVASRGNQELGRVRALTTTA